MSLLLVLLVGILLLWLLACGWAGYRLRPLALIAILCGGLALNSAWMVFGLDAHPLERHALTAHAAAILYAFSAFGIGYLIGRVMRHWRADRVEERPDRQEGSV
ncbi:hypothetical protein ACFSUD_03015 [Sulfitobacter aestuarii]|uniref:Uncharacterized protein n=1 Tax=Sulfitobacter aestuarii TaxID=2161676 RepID=A0ABW5U0F0_9RHOB